MVGGDPPRADARLLCAHDVEGVATDVANALRASPRAAIFLVDDITSAASQQPKRLACNTNGGNLQTQIIALMHGHALP